jgi:hypothetical protein
MANMTVFCQYLKIRTLHFWLDLTQATQLETVSNLGFYEGEMYDSKRWRH